MTFRVIAERQEIGTGYAINPIVSVFPFDVTGKLSAVSGVKNHAAAFAASSTMNTRFVSCRSCFVLMKLRSGVRKGNSFVTAPSI